MLFKFGESMMCPDDLFVLVACEESQIEAKAFRKRGFNAFSCDIQRPARGADLRYQIQGDVTPFLEGQTSFYTMDGAYHEVPGWHLIIAHPPCTYLCKVGSPHMWSNGVRVPERYNKMMKARAFFMKCLEAKCGHVAVENPLPMKLARLPQPDCFVQPYWYGDPYSKKTLYWLRNLPPLLPEYDMQGYRQFMKMRRGKYRSRAFEGIARAMADQWGDVLLIDESP